MNKRVSICTRSPLGTLLALTLVVAVLVYWGLYLVTDGMILSNTIQWTRGFFATSKTAISPLQQLADGLKKYRRVELLAIYGILILVLGCSVGIVGSFIRRYRFHFLSGKRLIERQALWCFIPGWFILWLSMFILVLLCDRGLVRWLLPALIEQDRIPKMGDWLFIPVWLALSMPISALLYFLLIHIPLSYFARRFLAWNLFIPMWRRPIPFSRIKRLEIQASGEGSTSLVLMLQGERPWTVSRGRPRRLQRLGDVLSRMLGLERRDSLTWM